jgi:hypothetical protein
MSDLLQRLVERTRAPAAAVEPLSPPRYAAAASSPSGFEEVDARSEAPPGAAASAPARQTGKPDGVTQALTGFVSARETIPAGPLAKGAALETSIANAVQFRSPSGPAADAASPAGGQGSREPRSEGWHHEAASKGFEIASAREQSEAAGRKSADGDSQPVHIFGSSPEIRETGMHSESGSSGPSISHHEPFLREQQARDATAPMPTSEVTISIGHIEVRNAPAPGRPRQPAFRPRVTLDEFLKRQPRGRQ